MQWDPVRRESGAARPRLGPVLGEITENFDHDVRGGRVPALHIPQRRR